MGLSFELALIILGDINLKWQKNLKAALEEWQTIAENPVLRYPGLFVCRNVTTYMQYVRVYLAYIAHQSLNAIDDFQSQYLDDEDNPTHSQLSKDHDDHPLHVIASQCAMELASKIGSRMQDVWNKKASINGLIELALGYYFHPAKNKATEPHKQVLELIKDWSNDKKNHPSIKRISSKDWIEYQSKRNRPILDELKRISEKYTGNESDLTKFFDLIIKKGERK